MTNEKAIMNLESWQIDLPTNSLQFEVFEKAIKALKVESCKKETEYGWIPVSERLPEEPYGCLVTVEDEEPMTGQMFETILPYHVGWDGERWNDADGEQCPFEVTAWIPLPKPYKAESEVNTDADSN